MENKWVCYLIANGGYTYVGVSPTPEKRLRQHNGEIKGGAKYTTSKGPGWKHVCIIEGFQDKIQAMQFEWAVKHEPPRNLGGVAARIEKIKRVMAKERWTSNAPLSSSVDLIVNYI